MNIVLERQKQLIEEFSRFTSWEEKYKHLIEIGKALPELPESLKTDEAKVKGCQSQVWLHAQLNKQGEVVFEGDSDALIVRGLLALLLKTYSQASPELILHTQPEFIQKIGFAGNLSPSRANGLLAMVKQMKNFATVFLYQKNQTKNE